MKTSSSFLKVNTRIIALLLVFAAALVATDCSKKKKGSFFLPFGSTKEARLNQLSVTNTGALALNGPFNRNNTGPYEWQVPKDTDEITILAITKSTKAVATLDGDPFDADAHTLTVDYNPVLDAGSGNRYQDYNIVVTAEDTITVLTYQLRVIEEKNHEAGLNDITVSVGALDPSFVSGTTDYTNYHLPYDTTSIDVTATLTDSLASLTINDIPATSGVARAIDLTSLAADDDTVQTVSIVVTAEDGTTTRNYTIDLTKQCENSEDCPPAAMDEARLSSLSVNDASALSPAFGSDNSGPYEVTTDTRGVATVTIHAVPIASPASVRIDGVLTNPVNDDLTVSFAGETQDYVIEVTAKDGTTTRTYNLTVNRLPNDDSSLDDLTVSAGALDPVFASGTISYNVELPYDATSVDVTASLADDENATMTFNDGNGTPTSAQGTDVARPIDVSALPADGETTQTVSIVVTAQNGTTTRTYAITFIKQEAPCGNELVTLEFSLGALSPALVSGTYDYDLLVPHGATSVNVTPTAPSCATLTVNGTPVASGESTAVSLTFPATITIAVTATGTSTYTITVIEDNSTENRLSNLTSDLGSWSPTPFNADTYEYTLNVDFGTTSVNLTPTTMSEHATLTVEGNTATSGSAYAVSLAGNKDVIIEVTAQKVGTPAQQYLVHIVVGPSTENRLSDLSTSPVNISGFDVNGTAYSVTVPYGTSSIGITATAMSTAASMTIDGSSATSGIEKSVSITGSPQSIPIIVTSQSGVARTVTVTVTTSPCNTSNSLSGLTTSAGSWNTPFVSGTYNYDVTEAWSVSSVDIVATAASGTSSVSINGTPGSTRTITLGAQGSTTTVTVAVTSQCGVTQNYTIDLVRGTCNSNNALSSLTTSTGDWNTAFASGTFDYDVTVGCAVTSIDVSASADPTASVMINGVAGATRTIGLGAKGSTTTVTVTVTSQCGVTQNYTLDVVRPYCADADLTGIGLSPDGTWDQVFSSSVLAYHVDVATGTASVNVAASLSDINASATINGTPGATGTVALGGNGSTTTITIEVTAENGSTKKSYTIDVYVGESPNANLATLTTDPNGTWSQAFANNVLTYTVTEASTVTSVDVAATSEDSNATIDLDGATGTGSASKTIALGAPGSTRTVSIAVTAQAGAPTKTYTLNLYRACSSNNSLSALTTDPNGTWSEPFDSGTLSYEIDEAWNVESVDIAATRADSTASVSINGVAGATRTISLGAMGSTTVIEIVVTNECGTAKTYSLEVNRGTCNANNSLSNLTTSAGSWNTPFASGTFDYDVTEAWNVSSVDITATAAAGTSSVSINGVAGATRTIALGAQGSTTAVTVAVTSECGVTQNYTIDLIRGICNADNSLSALTISPAGTWNTPFASGTYAYTVNEAWSVSSVDVVASAAAGTSSVTINGVAGSTRTITLGAMGSSTMVTIAVTSECGVTQNYVIEIVRPGCSNNTNLAALTTTPAGSWNTPFTPLTTTYSVDYGFAVTSIDVVATVADSESTVTINGVAGATRTIALGAMGSTTIIEIEVTSQCMGTKTYTLNMVRGSCSDNNNLSALSTTPTGTWSAPFASGTLTYTVNQAWGVESVDVAATRADSTASVSINGVAGATRTISLGAQGSTTVIEVVVTSQCGTAKTYTLNVVRGTCSSDNNLSSVTTNPSGSWDTVFGSGTTEYTITYENTDTSVDVAVVRSNINASVTINGTSGLTGTIALGNPGETVTATIVVTPECTGGTTKTYKLHMTRPGNGNANLSALTTNPAGTWDQSFSATVTTYHVDQTAATTSVNVTATLDDPAASMTIDGTGQESGDARAITLGGYGSTTEVVIEVTSQNLAVTKIYRVNLHRNCSANNSLSSLTTDPTGTWNTPFVSGTFDYDVNEAWNATSVDIAATLADPTASVTINGTAGATRTIALGAMGSTTPVTIAVTSQCGVTQNYTLDLVRGTCNSNNSLSALTTSAGTWNTPFVSGTFDYDVTEAWNATSVDIVASAAAGTSSVSINGVAGATRTITLGAQGSTTPVTIAVTSECGVTQNYTIDLVRGTCNSNNSLSGLTTSIGTWNTPFVSGTFDYDVNEDWNTTSVDVAASVADPTASVTINGTAGATRTISLGAQGSTTPVTIAVTSECGVTQNYTIDLLRGTCNSNNSLSGLTTSIGTWNTPFVSGTFDYDVAEAWNTTSVDVTATLADASATMTINGTTQASGVSRNISLGAMGSTTPVTIAVTSQCGVTQNYTLDLVRGTCNSNNSLTSLTTTPTGNWNTPFASGTYDYDVTEAWSVSSVDIVATAAAGTSSITINGVSGATRTIALGAMGSTTTVTIAVTSECGVVQNYTIDLIRGTCNSNNSLSSLTTSAGTWNTPFASGTYDYDVTEAWNVSSVDVVASAAAGTSSVTINGVAGSTRTISLGAQGSTTTVTIAVTNECGTTQNYTLDITRNTCNSNNSLSNLTTSVGAWNTPFASGTYDYDVTEAWNATSVDIVASVATGTSSVSINGTPGATRTISLGAQGSTTTVTIAVTSECGVVQNYTIDLIRGTCNSNNSLSGLTTSVGAWNTPFASGTYDYDVTEAWATTSVDVTATLADASATMTINGTSQASGATRSITLGAQGSTTTVTVAVTSQCGVVQNYTLDLVRGSCNSNNSLSGLATSVGTWNTPFVSGTYDYDVNEAWATTSVDVTATLADASATMTINGTSQASGATRSITLGAQGSTTTVTVAVTSQCGVTQNYTIDLVRGTCNGVNTLSTLTVSDSTLWTPVFASGTTTYHVDVPSTITSVNVAASVTSVLASANVNGSGTSTATIALGGYDSMTTLTVIVTPECGTPTNTYTVVVHRQPCSTVNTLDSLTVSDADLWTPAFASGTNSYHVDVDDSISSVNVVAAVTNSLASANVNGSGNSTATVTLGAAGSETTFTVVVTPECGTPTNTYTVVVHRQDVCSTVNTLSSLTVSDSTLWTPTFASGTNTYHVDVASTTASVNVVAAVSDSNASANVNGSGASTSTITLGAAGSETTFTVVVTPQCGTPTNTYTVTVHRQPPPCSNVSSLSALTVSAGSLSPGFASGTLTYSDSIPYCTSSMNVTATTTNGNATMTINGTSATSGSPFSVSTSGSSGTVTIIVTDQCGTGTTTYVINWAKASAPNVNLSALSVRQDTATYKKLYQNGFNPTTAGFDASITTYACVLQGNQTSTTASITISATLADASNTMTIGGTTVASGGSTTITMTAGESRSVAVIVTGASPNTCATKTYTLNLRVLNIYEVYYGYYAPVGLLNKQYSWVNPVQSPETPPLSGEYTNTHTAYLNQSSGTMVWGVKWVTVLVQAQSQMRFTAYNNFGDALNETLSRHDGDERWPTTLPYALDYIEDLATKGYVVTGNMTALTNTSGNGTQTGTVPMNSTYGNTIISMALNLTIQNRDAVVGDNSYTNVTYMGVTKRLKYLATTAAKKSLASAYWTPSVPWVKTDFMDAGWVE